jgi:hypothetical protein
MQQEKPKTFVFFIDLVVEYINYRSVEMVSIIYHSSLNMPHLVYINIECLSNSQSIANSIAKGSLQIERTRFSRMKHKMIVMYYYYYW